MKKIVSIVGMAALVAGLSFADAGVSVGGWGRIELGAKSTDGADATWFTGPGWASNEATFTDSSSGTKVTQAATNWGRVGFSFNGHSDNVFASVNLDSNGTTFGVGDQAKIGVKFNDLVTVQAGKIQGDVLRGKFGDFANTSKVNTTGEDDIFTRFYPKNGALLDVTPVPGLYVGLANEFASGKVADGTNVQAGVGYTIEKIGLIRAQYRGAVKPIYEAAFQLTAIDKFSADVGVKVPTADGAKVSAAAGLSYAGIDKLDLQGRFSYADKDAGGILVAAQAAYKVDGPLSVGVGVSDKAITTSQTTLQIAPFAQLAYSNGVFDVGFIYEVAAKNTWTIPVTLDYWF